MSARSYALIQRKLYQRKLYYIECVAAEFQCPNGLYLFMCFIVSTTTERGNAKMSYSKVE